MKKKVDTLKNTLKRDNEPNKSRSERNSKDKNPAPKHLRFPTKCQEIEESRGDNMEHPL